MNWFSAAGRICLLTVFAALLGWYYGHTLAVVAATLLCLVLFWLHQLRRVQCWLEDPEKPPPDVYGIWGDLLARIYLHQRKNRETREQLQSAVEYLQDSFASMRDGVLMVDEQGAIKWFNHAIEPLLGLRYPDDRGQTLGNLVRAPEFIKYFVAGDYHEPLQYHTSGDTNTYLRVEITRFGAAERLLFVRNVTDTVRMEQIRRDFVGNVSHELRTPLTVISGYLATFLADTATLPAPYTKALQQMAQQAERMENLLRDLLWLSRIESEQREDKKELVDIAALLEELRDELAGTHPGRQLELELDTRYRLHGDYRELYSAISNLVLNAFKYSSADSAVTISWSECGQEGHLSVRDQGEGIASIHIPRLSERFYRVDDSRSSTTGGTGLGLAIVKHVAAAHDARLQIESELGKGSTFTLVFPLRE